MNALLRDYFRRRRFWIGAGLLFCLITAPATAEIGLNVAGVVAVVFAFGSFVGEVETTSATLRRTLPCTRRQIGLAHWTTSVVLFAGIAAFAEFISALLASKTVFDAAIHAADRAVSTAGVSALAVLGFSVLAKMFTLPWQSAIAAYLALGAVATMYMTVTIGSAITLLFSLGFDIESATTLLYALAFLGLFASLSFVALLGDANTGRVIRVVQPSAWVPTGIFAPPILPSLTTSRRKRIRSYPFPSLEPLADSTLLSLVAVFGQYLFEVASDGVSALFATDSWSRHAGSLLTIATMYVLIFVDRNSNRVWRTLPVGTARLCCLICGHPFALILPVALVHGALFYYAGVERSVLLDMASDCLLAMSILCVAQFGRILNLPIQVRLLLWFPLYMASMYFFLSIGHEPAAHLALTTVLPVTVGLLVLNWVAAYYALSRTRRFYRLLPGLELSRRKEI